MSAMEIGALMIQVILVRWTCALISPKDWKQIVFWAWLYATACTIAFIQLVPEPHFSRSVAWPVATAVGLVRAIAVSVVVAALMSLLNRATTARWFNRG